MRRTNLQDIVDDEMATDHDEKQAHVDPAEEAELPPKLVSLEVGDESDKTEDVEHEGDETMMPSEGNEVCVYKHNVL